MGEMIKAKVLHKFAYYINGRVYDPGEVVELPPWDFEEFKKCGYVEEYKEPRKRTAKKND